MQRRSFLKTAGSILAATAMACCGACSCTRKFAPHPADQSQLALSSGSSRRRSSAFI